ncbi:MAG: cytochrome b/b6 domain-containing protein [Oligoflexia bacterium]|nr:cytochrome b/b6 domain-containing protein [Oligoflexia bacterium]
MENTPVNLWDIPTRILHWALAVCVLLNLFLLEEGEEAHEWAGYIAVGIVFIRFVWGFVGGKASRFSSFPIHPRSLISYLKNKCSEDGQFKNKHNPLASLVYLTLWLLIIGMGITGWMMNLDQFWGEDWVENLHSRISQGIEILLILHILGIAIDSIRYKRHTWLAMFTGKR